MRFFTLGLVYMTCQLTFSGQIYAQSYSADVPLGGRSTLMGGTGVALGRDGAAPFLNPATLGRIADNRVAFSVHFYRYQQTNVEGLFGAPALLDVKPKDASSSSFTGLPSTFCAFITLSGLIPEEAKGLWQTVRGKSGRTKLGLCGATIEREQFSVDAESRRTNSEIHHAYLFYNLDESWNRQSLGPSLSYQITDTLSVGASFQVITTKARQSWDLAAIIDDNDSHVTLRHLNGSSVDGATTMGVTWSRYPLTLGLSARLPSIGFYDSSKMTYFTASPDKSPTYAVGQGKLDAPIAPFLALGTGLEGERASFEFDVSTSFGHRPGVVTQLTEKGTDGTRTVGHRQTIRPTVGFRTGGEWFFSESLSLLAGARYESSQFRESVGSAAYRLGPTPRHFIAGSFGLGSYFRGSELLLGCELSRAFGRVPVLTSASSGENYSNTGYKNTSLLLVVSGSVGLASVRHTFSNFEQLKRSPKEPR